MVDYWKSQAKKFCDFCKCWIADNKPSIEFHEKGKRHKENVTKRLSEMTKKSQKEFKEQLQVDHEMQKMEQAALKAYMKDVEASADYSSKIIQEKLSEKQVAKESEHCQPCLPVNSNALEKQSKKQVAKKSEHCQPCLPVNSNAAEKQSKKQVAKKSEHCQPCLPVNSNTAEKQSKKQVAKKSEHCQPCLPVNSNTAEKQSKKQVATPECKETTVAKETKKLAEDEKWYEAKSAEGHTYYWHVETGESRWEEPEEGYLSSEQQRELAKLEERKHSEREKTKHLEEQNKLREEKKIESECAGLVMLGPAPKPDPYGAWSVVDRRVPETVDLQLPQQEYVAVKVPALPEEPPPIKFKEKTVALPIDDSETNISFRKRKFGFDPKRHIRQRLDD